MDPFMLADAVGEIDDVGGFIMENAPAALAKLNGKKVHIIKWTSPGVGTVVLFFAV